jgi:FKBP-type peptidyl-prolyl cis-trans isomerase
MVFGVAGCKDETQPAKKLSEAEIKERLIEANQKRVKREKTNIDSLLESKGWHMTSTGTGLRYQILENGSGDSVKTNDRVEVEYDIISLTGDTIYSSSTKGTEEFKVGMDHIETGIHEAVALMRVGDKARVVLPAHLAHGLLGDDRDIPSNASLVYYLEIVAVK